jgi:hypothetical protein
MSNTCFGLCLRLVCTPNSCVYSGCILCNRFDILRCNYETDYTKLSIYLSIHPPTYLPIYSSTALVDLGRFKIFSPHTAGRTPWTGDQPVGRPLPAYRTKQIQNKRKQTSIPRMGFERTILMFERAKTFHALYRVVIVFGHYTNYTQC